VLNCHARESGFTISLVHPEGGEIYCTPRSEVVIGQEKYECLVKEYTDYSENLQSGQLIVTKKNVYCWVGKSIELDNKDFNGAKIMSLTKDPTSGELKEIDVDTLGRYDEEYESRYPVPGFRLRLALNESGQRKLRSLAKNNAGRSLAMIFDGKLLMVSPVQERMADNYLVVTSLLYREARQLKETILKGR
jgi:preprotein translocase subunit SecD